MYPDRNPLQLKLEADQCINGLYIQTSSVDCVELAAAAGFDYVILDEEHGTFGYAETVQMIRAAEASGICPIVRVPDHNAAHLRKVVEAGAMGVYVPDVRTAEQARAAIAAVKFRLGDNDGARGACPTIRATRSRGAEWGSFVEWSNRNIMIALLVESQQGFDNLDEILQVPGIDTIVLGRFDLAHELGLHGDRYGERLDSMFEQFVVKARAAGVPFLARLKTLEFDSASRERSHWIARGARIFNLGSDREFISRVFKQVLEPMRSVPVGAH